MRSTVCLCVTVLLLAGAAASPAAPPPGDDIIGLYTAGDGSGFDRYEGAGPTVRVYIVYSGLTGTGIGGWETNVEQVGAGVLFLSATLLGTGPVNLFTAPVFQVGLDVPMTSPGPYGTFAVASLNYFVTNPSAPTALLLNAIPDTSWPEDPGPGYADAEDVGLLIRCTPSSGSQVDPSFGFWTDPFCCGPPVEPWSWGAVKGLYRD